MTYKVVRLLRNKRSGQILQQNYTKQTLFHRFSEEDYIQIGILLYYYFDIENSPNKMDIDVNKYNALEIFSKKGQEYITNPNHGNMIKLSDFDGTHNEISTVNYVEYIDKWKQLDLRKLGNYGKNVGELSDNLLYLNYIEDNIINLKNFFKELSNEYDLSEQDIYYKNLKGFQIWRNRIINDTVINFDYSSINRNFLSFILIHLFILCHRRFRILDLEYFDDSGRTKMDKLHDIVKSKIKQIKNKIKKIKTKSRTRRKKSSSRKNSRRRRR
jgi:hypothetical protein